MKLPLLLVTILTALGLILAALGLAVPVYADSGPGGEPDADLTSASTNTAFLSSLRDAGISYDSGERAVSAAKAMCGLIDRGESGLQVIGELKQNNPGFSVENATHFATIAARAYCPQQLGSK